MFIRSPQDPQPSVPGITKDEEASMHAYWDAELKCWFASHDYCKWFGIKSDKLMHTSLRDLMGPTLFRENEPYIRAALAGAPQHFESIAVDPDGVSRTSMACYLPHIVNGEVAGFSMQISEISEHHTTWESFKQLADQFSRISTLQRNPDLYALPAHRYGQMGSWRWEIDSDVTSWSNTLYEIFGRDRNLKPPSFAEHPALYAPSSWKLLQRAVNQMLTTGEPYSLELEYIHSSGRKGWLEARSNAERDPASGRLVALHGTAHDITALRLSRESSVQAARIAELEKALLASKTRIAELEMALVHAQSVAAQGVEAPPRLVDLGSMLQTCADEVRMAARHGITLLLETDPAGTAVWAMVNPAGLKLALRHLLTNACEAMPGGGALVLGLVDTDRCPLAEMPTSQSMVGFQVRDTGGGMDADTLLCAREAFFTTKVGRPGAGMGLAMVRRFAQNAGGFLLLESAPGLGTTATILLPAAKGLPG